VDRYLLGFLEEPVPSAHKLSPAKTTPGHVIDDEKCALSYSHKIRRSTLILATLILCFIGIIGAQKCTAQLNSNNIFLIMNSSSILSQTTINCPTPISGLAADPYTYGIYYGITFNGTSNKLLTMNSSSILSQTTINCQTPITGLAVDPNTYGMYYGITFNGTSNKFLTMNSSSILSQTTINYPTPITGLAADPNTGGIYYGINFNGTSNKLLTMNSSGILSQTTINCSTPIEGLEVDPTTSGIYYGITFNDINPPTGSITINAGAAYTNSTSVVLSLSATDLYGTVAQMHFGNDGINWTTWEAHATSRAWSITPPGDGVKRVYVQFKDAAGNISSSFSDTITLDTTAPPVVSVSINAGAPYTRSTSVTLALSASDDSGVAQMCLSHDNSTWTDWETYNTSRA
jgi:hypothetical protein